MPTLVEHQHASLDPQLRRTRALHSPRCDQGCDDAPSEQLELRKRLHLKPRAQQHVHRQPQQTRACEHAQGPGRHARGWRQQRDARGQHRHRGRIGRWPRSTQAPYRPCAQHEKEHHRHAPDPVAPPHHQRGRWIVRGDVRGQHGLLADPGLRQHFTGVVDHRAQAVGGHAHLRHACFDAAERGNAEVQTRAVRGAAEPCVVGHAHDRLRAEPCAVDRELRMHVVEADQRHYIDLAPIGRAQRQHACAIARAPAAGPWQPAPQQRTVDPARHRFGQRKRMRLAIRAEASTVRFKKHGRVVFAVGIEVIAAEDQRDARGIDEALDLGIERCAIRIARMAERGRVDRLRPQQHIGPVIADGRP